MQGLRFWEVNSGSLLREAQRTTVRNLVDTQTAQCMAASSLREPVAYTIHSTLVFLVCFVYIVRDF